MEERTSPNKTDFESMAKADSPLSLVTLSAIYDGAADDNGI